MAIDDAAARGTTDSNGAAGMGRLGQQLLRLAVTICHAAKGSRWALVVIAFILRAHCSYILKGHLVMNRGMWIYIIENDMQASKDT
uniref:Uncharacterized protein n=1 Tax=Oryza meridionalis TaxID=40149 RepID=A0A0E0EAB2_9ORYZ